MFVCIAILNDLPLLITTDDGEEPVPLEREGVLIFNGTRASRLETVLHIIYTRQDTRDRCISGSQIYQAI